MDQTHLPSILCELMNIESRGRIGGCTEYLSGINLRVLRRLSDSLKLDVSGLSKTKMIAAIRFYAVEQKRKYGGKTDDTDHKERGMEHLV